MERLALPADLNGSLVAALLPLRTGSVPALAGESQQVSAGDEDPFLASRAERHALRPDRTWESRTEQPHYDSWAKPVLLAHAQRAISQEQVLFGRSASTVAEFEEFDQPIILPESTSVSLWLAPGMGLVLCLERLTATTSVAQATDHISSMLRVPAPKTDHPRNPYDVHDSVADAGDLFEEFAVHRGTTLLDLLPGQVEDLARIVPLDQALAKLLIPSRTARAGHRMIEGFVVGLGAAEHGAALGTEPLLMRETDDDDLDFDVSAEWQSAGYRWHYEPFQPATEPARPEALCAVRSDGRVAVVDLGALSIYHDYLGIGGQGIVRELIPLAAVAGQLAADQADVIDQLQKLAADGLPDDDALTGVLGLARRVRARLELRRLQQPQLLHEKNFRAWTIDESVRREMAPRAMQDQLSADGTSVSGQLNALARSVDSLEVALQRRADEVEVARERQREDERERLRSVVNFVFGVVTAVGVVAVFTSLASVPASAERAVPSLATAGLWTVFSLAAFALLGALGLVLVQGMRAIPGRRSRVAVQLLAVAGLGSGAGLLAPSELQAGLLAAACLIVVAAGFLIALDLRNHGRATG